MPKLERVNTMYPFTDRFMSSDKNVEFLKATMMGPNAMLTVGKLDTAPNKLAGRMFRLRKSLRAYLTEKGVNI